MREHTMVQFIYPVDVERDGEGFMATIPGIPGGTMGDTVAEAIANAAALLEDAIGAFIAESMDLPLAEDAGDRPTVTLAPPLAAKAAVYLAMRQAGITKAELGRRLGWHPPQVQRLFDLRHASRLDQIAAAMRVLGFRLVVGFEADAPAAGA